MVQSCHIIVLQDEVNKLITNNNNNLQQPALNKEQQNVEDTNRTYQGTESRTDLFTCSNCSLLHDLCSCYDDSICDVYFYDDCDSTFGLQSYTGSYLSPQSGETNYNVTVTEGSKTTSSQNVQFHDQNSTWAYNVDSQPDPSFGAADQSDTDLGSFFERPLKIFDTDWATTDANFADTFNPWSLYFENPRVANRIANFNNLRAKLKLKFVINGNGFFYGRVLVSYTPLETIDATLPTRAFVSQDLIGASQKPHIYLDPCTSQGGELTLPFFWYRNALRIPLSEWQNMGQIDINAFEILKHANGATDAVRITVFAWTEDLVLSTPTNQNPSTLTAQSGEISKDEYGGKVSGPATALAKVAGALSNIPVINMYARASQLALSAVADVAAMFGYCRPVVDAPVVPYRPAYMGNMPNTNTPDSSTKLTFDLKQETTVDPRTTGLSGIDEMSIRSIVTRESFLTIVPWHRSADPGDRLCTFGVTPMNWDEFNGGPQTEYHMTPACHLGCMFENWRGTMKYRFQIIASNFHKGRLQVQYDPYDSAGNEFNVAYNRVVDISEEKDFTIEVGWGIPDTFGNVMNPGISGLNFRNSSTALAFPTASPDIYNGQISVWVLNDLTTPNSVVTNDVSINVFVSCGDDFEYANPAEYFGDLVWFPNPDLAEFGESQVEELTDAQLFDLENAHPSKQQPELVEKVKRLRKERRDPSGVIDSIPEETVPVLEPQSGEELVAPDLENTINPSRPVSDLPDTKVAGKEDHTSPLSAICFGESVSSVRSMLKRYSMYGVFQTPDQANNWVGYTALLRYNLPLPRGYAPTGTDRAVSGTNYNYVNQTPIGWMAPCYQGWRGGLRRKCLHFGGKDNDILKGWVNVKRFSRPDGGALAVPAVVGQIITTGTQSLLAYAIRRYNTYYSGNQATPLVQNPVLEYELPYHSNYRFQPTRVLEPNSADGRVFSNFHELNYTWYARGVSGNVLNFEHSAAGDDFSLFFYTNVPVCYYEPGYPAPQV